MLGKFTLDVHGNIVRVFIGEKFDSTQVSFVSSNRGETNDADNQDTTAVANPEEIDIDDEDDDDGNEQGTRS